MRRVVTLALTIVGSLVAAAPALAADQAACPPVPPPGYVTCAAVMHVAAPSLFSPFAALAPAGYRPLDLQTAYGLARAAAANGSAQTIAIVDAYDDPSAASDLATYRAVVGLRPCTTATGCLQKVSQVGGTALPAPDPNWSKEISLDLDMASAICPNCRLLLVEARSNGYGDMLAAEDYATAHATVVSNSWGGPEFSGEPAYDVHFRKSLPIVFSTGDLGFAVQYPAASPYVIAVGGTSLVRSSRTARGFVETAWAGTGSGCSRYETKPTWQGDAGCRTRTVADVSAVADPATGVAVYDSYGGAGGWLVGGGTSAAAPIVAATFALAGAQATSTYNVLPYDHVSALFDVTSGSNGKCVPGYLCNAGAGYDAPTGLGSPNGLAGF